MTLREQIEAYVNIEYDDPTDNSKWEITEKEDGTIHLKYVRYIRNKQDSHVISAVDDLYNGPCAQYQLIDEIRQKTYCLYHEVHDRAIELTEGNT